MICADRSVFLPTHKPADQIEATGQTYHIKNINFSMGNNRPVIPFFSLKANIIG
jgi:hypothetical protein